jgi:hypothetical protein
MRCCDTEADFQAALMASEALTAEAKACAASADAHGELIEIELAHQRAQAEVELAAEAPKPAESEHDNLIETHNGIAGERCVQHELEAPIAAERNAAPYEAEISDCTDPSVARPELAEEARRKTMGMRPVLDGWRQTQRPYRRAAVAVLAVAVTMVIGSSGFAPATADIAAVSVIKPIQAPEPHAASPAERNTTEGLRLKVDQTLANPPGKNPQVAAKGAD